MTKKKGPEKKKRTKREIALANLERANAVKRGGLCDEKVVSKKKDCKEYK